MIHFEDVLGVSGVLGFLEVVLRVVELVQGLFEMWGYMSLRWSQVSLRRFHVFGLRF